MFGEGNLASSCPCLGFPALGPVGLSLCISAPQAVSVAKEGACKPGLWIQSGLTSPKCIQQPESYFLIENGEWGHLAPVTSGWGWVCSESGHLASPGSL